MPLLGGHTMEKTGAARESKIIQGQPGKSRRMMFRVLAAC